MSGRDLTLLPGELAIVRLPAGADARTWARPGAAGLLSVTESAEETSVVCDPAATPPGCETSGPWRALVVAGPLDHALTGVLAAIATPLADAGVPIFAVSTFDTDYVLIPAERAGVAIAALRRAGHGVAAPGPGD